MIMTIDLHSFVPAYHQLADILRDQLDRGELAPGDPMPSEQQMMDRYGIGRVAVRNALAVLRQEGRIVTERRRGSFVPEEVQRRVVEIEGPASLISRMPTPQERREHGIREGVPVLVIEREGAEPELLPADRVTIWMPGRA